MTSAICYKGNQVWGTNGTIEEILIKLIKYSPEDSRLLQWSVEHYREFFPGICCYLTDVLTTDEEISQWQTAIREALEDIKVSNSWTEYGKQWLADNFDFLLKITEE